MRLLVCRALKVDHVCMQCGTDTFLHKLVLFEDPSVDLPPHARLFVLEIIYAHMHVVQSLRTETDTNVPFYLNLETTTKEELDMHG
jgi:uncharacterized protein (DUF983 family)